MNFGAGLGFVDVFSPRGRLLMRLERGDWFNAPFGLVLAPTDFGSFSHKLIVGQFGSGEILAFNAITGRFEGKIRDQNNNVIVLPALWGISFGAGQPSPQNSGPANALFFNAYDHRLTPDLAKSNAVCYLASMTTLSEVEAVVDQLPLWNSRSCSNISPRHSGRASQ